MNELSSEARKATSAAISCGCPERPSGASFTAAALASPGARPSRRWNSESMKSHIGVTVTCPGQYAFTVIPCGASSTARLCVSPMTPNLLAAYGGDVRAAAPAGTRRAVEDPAAAALLDHLSRRLAAAEEDAAKIDRMKALPALERLLDERRDLDRRGVVDHDVEAPELRDRRLDRGCDVRLARHVAVQCDRPGPRVDQPVGCRRGGLFVQRHDGDGGALGGEPFAHGETETARAAGHKRGLAVEPAHAAQSRRTGRFAATGSRLTAPAGGRTVAHTRDGYPRM